MKQSNNRTIKQSRNTVYAGMSGGVDSSVAAYLLKESGYRVVGVFMRCVNIDGCQQKDEADARRVAATLGIPFYVWDFEEQYRKKVVDYMIEGYRRGETPNPDVMCNREIKFGLFFERAMKEGADYVATGHYARKAEIGGIPAIQAGIDRGKDQSYFLWTLNPDVVKKSLFPVGEYKKSKVREFAEQAGLSVAHKKDSQGICFLGQVDLVDFLSDYIKSSPGKVLNVDGEIVGEHEGAAFYTIGQRHGFAVFTQTPETKPHYVAEKDVSANTITVVEGRESVELYQKDIELIDLFVHPSVSAERDNLPVRARIRYQQPLVDAELNTESQTLIFKEPQKFIARGQSAVCYDKEGRVIAGGVIR